MKIFFLIGGSLFFPFYLFIFRFICLFSVLFVYFPFYLFIFRFICLFSVFFFLFYLFIFRFICLFYVFIFCEIIFVNKKTKFKSFSAYFFF